MIKSNTCLAVLMHKDKLYFAGDRRISWGLHKAQRGPRPKVTHRDGVLFAGTGTSALCDEITDLFVVPDRYPGSDAFEYFHHSLLPHVLAHLETKGYVNRGERHLRRNDKDKEDDMLIAIILVGIDDCLFELDINTSVISGDQIVTPYASGCGGAYALGSLMTTEGSKLGPEARLIKALRIAASISPGCDGHIDVVHN